MQTPRLHAERPSISGPEAGEEQVCDHEHRQLMRQVSGIDRLSATSGYERQRAKHHQGQHEQTVVDNRAKTPA
jgi:hypothetical protein